MRISGRSLHLFGTAGCDPPGPPLADAVGMSVGLLFHYFDSKERLYEELVRIGRERALATMSATPSDPLGYFEAVAERLFITTFFRLTTVFSTGNEAKSLARFANEFD